jgi:hypothetical protein
MRTRTLLLLAAVAAVPLSFALLAAPAADAQSPAPGPTGTGLGAVPTLVIDPTVQNGQGTCAPTALPKIGVVPLITTDAADAAVQLVVKRDFDLSGVYDVIGDAANPSGPYTRGTNLDLVAWRKKDAEYVVRVYANTKPLGVQHRRQD